MSTTQEPSLGQIVTQKIEAWKQKHGEDVEVKMIYISGSYYKDRPAQWFGYTARFQVGPYTDIDEVLSRLTRLMET